MLAGRHRMILPQALSKQMAQQRRAMAVMDKDYFGRHLPNCHNTVASKMGKTMEDPNIL